MNALQQIPVTITDRRWMQIKSWRIHLALPTNNNLLPVQLTALVDRNVNLSIENQDSRIEIKPCYVVNVLSKGKKFVLVVETCYEHQNLIVGTRVTGMLGESALLSIWEATEQAPRPTAKKEPKKEPVSEERRKALFGFHRLFTVPKFQAFISSKTGKPVADEEGCINAFRDYMGIQSRSELDNEVMDAIREEFNEWLTKGRA